MRATRNRLYRTLESVLGYLERMKSQDFFSDVSDICLGSYKSFIAYFVDNFSQIEESSYEPIYVYLVSQLIPELRYVERSSTRNIPWSIVPFLNRLLREELGPEYMLLIRPQWHFNYSVITTDLVRSLKSVLEQVFPSRRGKLDGVFTDRKIHIFTFPYLERTNVLLHSVIGHEIGHFFHDKWLSSPAGKAKVDATRAALAAYYSRTSQPDLFLPYDKTTEGMNIIEGMCREAFADIAGYLVFGPSLLYALEHLLIFERKARVPSKENNYYPATKYRVRVLYDHLYRTDARMDRLIDDVSPFGEWLRAKDSEIQQALSVADDTLSLAGYPEEKRLFEEALPEYISFARSAVKRDYFDPNIAPRLFENLSIDLPVNEIDGRPVNMVNILFAGWIYFTKLSREEQEGNYLRGYQVLCRLLLKSIYSSFIHEEYLAQSTKV